ncbi:hypothetical protein BDY21DRAFT_420982 [Lineolata rhizophorae]|uniref:Uncharacterized protein n=1 Tax=Lineolata rhizophorae TaxID=578093 RepID=A0A6A6P4K1_9PEZI|nr:hypothetical protein BDY21DRAFT_420982 [Lineolata rhizophorae]
MVVPVLAASKLCRGRLWLPPEVGQGRRSGLGVFENPVLAIYTSAGYRAGSGNEAPGERQGAEGLVACEGREWKERYQGARCRNVEKKKHVLHLPAAFPKQIHTTQRREHSTNGGPAGRRAAPPVAGVASVRLREHDGGIPGSRRTAECFLSPDRHGVEPTLRKKVPLRAPRAAVGALAYPGSMDLARWLGRIGGPIGQAGPDEAQWVDDGPTTSLYPSVHSNRVVSGRLGPWDMGDPSNFNPPVRGRR